VPVGHSFICEGREGCKSPTEAGSHEQSPSVMLVVGGPGENVSHDETADHVYDEGSVRKAMMVGKL